MAKNLYPGYGYIRDDNSLFRLYRHEKHRDIGILVPPKSIEVSGSTLSGLLQAIHKEGITKVIFDISQHPLEIGRSYATRILKSAEAEGIKVVIFNLAMFETYPIVFTLEEAVNKLLRS